MVQKQSLCNGSQRAQVVLTIRELTTSKHSFLVIDMHLDNNLAFYLLRCKYKCWCWVEWGKVNIWMAFHGGMVIVKSNFGE